MKTYIFGYGSLVAPPGINGRGMRFKYQKKDLIESDLLDYRREWNVWAGHTYLGIVPKLGAITNGVIFPIGEEDLPAFKESEGFCFVKSVYGDDLVDITDKLTTKIENGRVYSCVANVLDYRENISIHYLSLIQECLKIRGLEFTERFHLLTKHNKQATKFFKL